MTQVSQGQFAIIDVDGTITIVTDTVSYERVKKVLGCDITDSVDLHENQILMVDDSGRIDGLPLNKAATALASQRLGRKYEIYGKAVLVNDRDF